MFFFKWLWEMIQLAMSITVDLNIKYMRLLTRVMTFRHMVIQKQWKSQLIHLLSAIWLTIKPQTPPSNHNESMRVFMPSLYEESQALYEYYILHLMEWFKWFEFHSLAITHSFRRQYAQSLSASLVCGAARTEILRAIPTATLCRHAI